MQRKLLISLCLIVGALLTSIQPAHAWSSPASKTDSDIRELVMAIRLYREDIGLFPSADQYWAELTQAKVWTPKTPGPPLDRWGHSLIYRTPGMHGDFDVYSFGPDGIDNDGAHDDVSSWAGVNDGFHWKATWPRGRFAIGLGIVLGIICIFLGRYISWWLALSLAGAVICFSVALGCHWLRHPGIVSSRNNPLSLISIAASLALAAFLFSAIVSLITRGLRIGLRRARSYDAAE